MNIQDIRENVRRAGGWLDTEKLVGLLLNQGWHNRCEIIPDYLPPFPAP